MANILEFEYFDVWDNDLMGPFMSADGMKYIWLFLTMF